MSATQNARTAALEAVIVAHATELKLPTIRRRFKTLADEATREQQPPVAYLAALLEAEIAERAERCERRLLNDARFPTLKYLQDFRFDENPKIPQATITALAEGSWITDRESVILIGDSGTALSGGPAELGEHARRRARCLRDLRVLVEAEVLEVLQRGEAGVVQAPSLASLGALGDLGLQERGEVGDRWLLLAGRFVGERFEAPAPERRPLPRAEVLAGLPLRREPEDPAGHDRRLGGGLVDH